MNSTGFLFSGQGSQAVGMGRAFYDADADIRKLFDDAEKAVGLPLLKVMFEGPEEELTRTDYTQPAIGLVSLAALRALRKKNINPASAVGHSLGEYPALVAAGSLGELDAVRIVAARGRAMQAAAERAPGKMAAVVGLTADQIRAVVDPMAGVQIGAYNAPDQTVISGEATAVEAAAAALTAAGAKRAVVLNTSGAWHSHLMAPAQQELSRVLASIEFRPPAIPVFANATAEPFGADPTAMRELLVRQLVSPVRFVECAQKLLASGIDRAVECGPGRVLCGLIKKLDRQFQAAPGETPDAVDAFAGKT